MTRKTFVFLFLLFLASGTALFARESEGHRNNSLLLNGNFWKVQFISIYSISASPLVVFLFLGVGYFAFLRAQAKIVRENA